MSDKTMSFGSIVLLVIFLMAAVPGFMLLCFFFPATMLTIGLIIFLSLFLYLQPPQETP